MKTVRTALVAIAAVALANGVAHAQGGFPGGGSGGPPPEMMKKFQAMRQWFDTHKNVRQVSTTFGAFAELDKEPATKVSKDQAKKVLAIVNAWQSKPVMSNDQAGTVSKELAGTMTMTQLKKMATMKGPGMGGGRGGGMGGGRPGGGGGMGGGRPGGGGGGFNAASIPDPKEYNPLSPKTFWNSPWKDRTISRFNSTLTLLKSRAAG